MKIISHSFNGRHLVQSYRNNLRMKELACDVLLELTQCSIVTITTAQVSVSHINNVHQFVSGVTIGPHFAAFTHSVHTYGHLQLS